MGTMLQRINHGLAAGAVAGLATTILIWLVSQLGLLIVIGLPLLFELTPQWIYERVVWNALWGLLFMVPLLNAWPHRRRGLVIGLVPACATLFFFLPVLDGHGWLGLDLGAAMPAVVIFFNMLWGYLAGIWLEYSLRGGE